MSLDLSPGCLTLSTLASSQLRGGGGGGVDNYLQRLTLTLNRF